MIISKKYYQKYSFLRSYVLAFWSTTFYLLRILRINKTKNYITGAENIKLKGLPILKLDSLDNLRCTSCNLCSEICPSSCIHIEPNPESPEEAPPLSFHIEVLRCIFCGLCEEVCPVDAIEMGDRLPMAGHSEENWIWDQDKLVAMGGNKKSIVSDSSRPLLP